MKKNLIGIGTGMLVGLLVGTCCNVFAAGITVEQAESIALKAAQLTKEEVVIAEEKTSVDDGRNIIEIDFIVPEQMKYEFDIDAETGAILDQDMDAWEADDTQEYAALIEQSKADKQGTEKKADAAAGITEEEAKEIALKDAGFKSSDVTFTKCRKDFDDGLEKFDIEFRTADGTEYDYDIRVSDGMILERDVDRD